MGTRSRRKGAQAERDLAKRFAEAMPGADVKRGLGQARCASEVADVETPYFWIESKHGRRPNPRAALAQAVEAARDGRVPVGVIRDDRREPFVVIGLEDFLRFVGEWWKHVSHDERVRQMVERIARDAEAKCAAVTVDDERDQGV